MKQLLPLLKNSIPSFTEKREDFKCYIREQIFLVNFQVPYRGKLNEWCIRHIDKVLVPGKSCFFFSS